MTTHLQLSVHVSEPWDFERLTGLVDLSGWTVDHADPDKDAWEVHLDTPFDYNERHIGTVLASPRYVGEHMSRLFDAVTGFPVRLAHRDDGDWHYAFTAMISRRQPSAQEDNGAAI